MLSDNQVRQHLLECALLMDIVVEKVLDDV